MKTYKILIKIRVLALCFALLMSLLFGFILLDASQYVLRDMAFGIMGITFFILCAYVVCNLKIITDENKIQSIIDFIFFKISQQVYWKDVKSMSIIYFVNPSVLTNVNLQATTNVLYGLKEYEKDDMVLSSINFFPTNLLNDLLSRIPDDAETYLDPVIKNRFVRHYGAEVVQKFDNIGKEAYEPIPKAGVFTIKTLMSFLKTYMIILLGFFIYNRFWGHILSGEKELVGSLVLAFFGSLTYYIYWWFFGGNASS